MRVCVCATIKGGCSWERNLRRMDLSPWQCASERQLGCATILNIRECERDGFERVSWTRVSRVQLCCLNEECVASEFGALIAR
jgi:hypothetical protein